MKDKTTEMNRQEGKDFNYKISNMDTNSTHSSMIQDTMGEKVYFQYTILTTGTELRIINGCRFTALNKAQ